MSVICDWVKESVGGTLRHEGLSKISIVYIYIYFLVGVMGLALCNLRTQNSAKTRYTKRLQKISIFQLARHETSHISDVRARAFFPFPPSSSLSLILPPLHPQEPVFSSTFSPTFSLGQKCQYIEHHAQVSRAAALICLAWVSNLFFSNDFFILVEMRSRRKDFFVFMLEVHQIFCLVRCRSCDCS